MLTEAAGGRGDPVEVIFTPHLVPMDRGIFATIYAQPKGAVTEHDLLALYRSFYASSPFVRVVGHLPATKDSAVTNFCDITLRVVRGRIVVLACLDNLIKGAAGVAVQNLNLMMGCPEETACYRDHDRRMDQPSRCVSIIRRHRRTAETRPQVC